MKKKIILSIILSVNIFTNLFTSVFAQPSAESDNTSSQPELTAQAAILMDMKSGKVLYSKNENQKMYPASITKIMTAILALESGIDAQEVITATKEAINPITLEHSNMGILVGEELTFDNLINGLLIDSANDAANVLAIRVAGSLDGFVEMMNNKATELGATNTHFVNVHGFHDDNHYTTASDIAKIANYAMKNETFRKIVKTDMYTMGATNKYKEDRYLSNTNHLISKRSYQQYFYKKAIGIKTGYTGMDYSGYCLASAAVSGDTELLSVVLKSSQQDGLVYSFIDSKNLFEYGFNNFKYITIASTGTVVADSVVYEAKDGIRVTLTPQNDICSILPSDVDMKEIKSETVLNENIKAPISVGQVLGSVTYSYKGEQIGQASLVAVNEVEKDYIAAVIHLIFKIILNPIFIICLLLMLFFVFTSKTKRKKRRKQRRSRLNHIQ